MVMQFPQPSSDKGTAEPKRSKGSFIRKSKDHHLSWASNPPQNEEGIASPGRGVRQPPQERAAIHQSSTTPRGSSSGGEQKAMSPREAIKAEPPSAPAPKRSNSIVLKSSALAKPSPTQARRTGSFLGTTTLPSSRPGGSTIMPREKAFDCDLNLDLNLLKEFKEKERKGEYSQAAGATAPYQFLGDLREGGYSQDFEDEGQDDAFDALTLDRILKMSDDLAKNYKKWFQEMTLKVEEKKKTLDRKRRYNKDFTPRKDSVLKGGREHSSKGKEKSGVGYKRTISSPFKEGKGKTRLKDNTLREKGKEKEKEHLKGGGGKEEKHKGEGGKGEQNEREKDKEKEKEKETEWHGDRSKRGSKETANRENSRFDGTSSKGRKGAKVGGLDLHPAEEDDGRGGSPDIEKRKKGGFRNGDVSALPLNGSAACNGNSVSGGVGSGNGEFSKGQSSEEKSKGGGGEEGGSEGMEVGGDKKGKLKGKR